MEPRARNNELNIANPPLFDSEQKTRNCGEIGNPAGFQIIEIRNVKIP